MEYEKLNDTNHVATVTHDNHDPDDFFDDV